MTAQGSHSPGSSQAGHAVDQARQAAAGLAFRTAETQLEQFHALHATYAGTSLRGFGVSLVRADSAGYCLQGGSGTTEAHLAGPGGGVASGPC